MNPPYNPALLILDLDETLIHAAPKPLAREADFSVFNYSVYIRPHLHYFLKFVKPHYQLAVWSSASDDYVAEVVKRIFPADIPLEFVWGNSRCTPYFPAFDETSLVSPHGFGNYLYAKKLNKLRKRGWDINRMLIVDDTPAKVQFNYGNAIYVNEWTGQTDDKELYYLAFYLQSLRNVHNMRTIEKRNWKENLINRSADFLDVMFGFDTNENTGSK
ncbi:MAG: HAD family hydrolase [Bacteroidetes bacterium]|nr:HAD family hydrolase [Bacteroidota bacterium]